MKTYILCAAALLSLSTALGAADNSFIGAWKLNTAKSTFMSGPAIITMTMTFTQESAGVKRVAEGTFSDGKPIDEGGPQGTTFPWDGKEHIVSGDASPSIGVTVKVLTPRSVDVTVKVEGKVISRTHSSVAADGKTITEQETGIDEKGQPVRRTMIFDKQ